MPEEQERPHPLDREASDIVFGLLDRAGIPAPSDRAPVRFVVAGVAALIVGVHLAVVGAVAVAFVEPMLVPSIGPTVFLLVFAPTLKVCSAQRERLSPRTREGVLRRLPPVQKT